ncbi:Ubiquitin carboxyl-terminal hydrolase 8 [Schistosoma japonicum]|nr:Ubiquitin carboxyl-terminal hydrolase 8 [Schistosoma japonicum]
MNKKPLYLATSMEELKKLAKINIRSSVPLELQRDMSLIKCQANEVWEEDEERAYVLFLKYFEYYEKLKQLIGNKLSTTLKSELLSCIERAEILNEHLKIRYENLNRQIIRDVKKPIEPQQNNKPEKSSTTPSSSWIQTSELARLIQKQNNFLLIDVRPKKEFECCQIAFNNIINIPCDFIKRGTTVNNISDYLQKNNFFKKLWDSRSKFDGIILLDENGFDTDQCVLNKNHPLQIIKDALLKWDAEQAVTVEPRILFKGMSDFRIRYPPLLTQTTSFNQKDVKQISSRPEALQFKYPDLSIVENQFPSVNLADLLASQRKDPTLSFKSIQNGRAGAMNNGTNSVFKRPLAPKPSTFGNRVQYTPKMASTPSSEISSNNIKQTNSTIDRRFGVVSGLSNLSVGKSDLYSSNLPSNVPVQNDAVKEYNDTSNIVWKLSDDNLDEEFISCSDSKHHRLHPDRSLVMNRVSGQISENTFNNRSTSMSQDPWRSSLPTSPSSVSLQSVPSIPPSESKPTNILHPHLSHPSSHLSLTSINQSDALNNQAIHQTRTNGLRNLGNTCYMNSVVQSLAHTRALVHYFLDGFHERKAVVSNFLGYGGEIVKHFEILLSALYNQLNQDAELYKFRSAVAKHQAKFSSNDQQDSLEFLLFILDGLHEDLNEARSEKNNNSAKLEHNESTSEYSSSHEQAEAAWIKHKRFNNSIIVSSFQGLLRSTVKCNNCHVTSTTFDVFMVLSLPIEQNNTCQLTDCLKLFLEKEEMVGQCRWHCPTCNTRRDASKWIELWKLPTYLIIHLKRFRYEYDTWRKQTTNVDFPVESLDMSPFIVGPKLHSSEYALYSVLNHRGTMESGHYTTFCRNIRDGRWYEYDDENVSLLNKNQIQNDNAYILFYELLPRVGVFFENTHDTVQ